MYTDVYRCMQSMLYKLYKLYNVLLVSCRCQNCQTVSRSHQNYLTILWHFSSATRLKHSLWNRTMTDIEEAWYGLMGVADTVYHGVSWCIMMYHDVSCTEDMSRYAQYLQQPARHRNKGDGWRRMETDGDGWRPEVWSIAALPAQHTAQHSILMITALHCQWTVIVRYLEPVIAVLSHIWAEMDSMREHRLLRFKLLRPQNMKERIVLIIIVHTFRNYPMIMNWFHDRDLISHDSIHLLLLSDLFSAKT